MKALKWLDNNLEKSAIGVLLTMMIIVMSVQVVSRYVFNASLTWSEELTRYMFVWTGFLSLPYTIKHGLTLKIDQLFNLLPKGAQVVLNVVNHSLMIVFFVFMFYQSMGVVQSSLNSGQSSSALGIPTFLIQASALVGFGLAVIRTIQVLFGIFNNKEELVQ